MTDEQKEILGDHLANTSFYEVLLAIIDEKRGPAVNALTKKFSDPLTKITRLLEASGECSALDQLVFGLKACRATALQKLNPEK